MTRRFTAHLWREGDVWVAQCLEVDVASQGEAEEEALANLKEALELFLEPATPNRIPDVRTVEVELGPAA
jgi:predicted RNase H-like HicB family nuclease